MWKTNLEETKQHYINWWNHKGIVLNMWEHFQEGVSPHGPYSGEAPVSISSASRNNYGTGSLNLPGAPVPSSPSQRWFDPQWRAEYLDWYVGHSCLKADMLPVANTQLGPGSLAAILGAVYEGGDDTIWIHPDPHFSDKLHFNPEHENYLIHKNLLKACKAKANGNYYVGMPDLMEGLDVLAALKGTDKVLLDTVMQPEVVEEQLQYINDTYFKVFDELYDIIREGDEMAFCYFSAWAPGKMTKLQCDISTMISEADYRRFVQPYLREQCRKIPYTLYHLDGVGALHHLPAILEIEELNAIQWTPGVGEPQGGNAKWYDLYRKILDNGKSIMACWVTLDELRPLLDNIGGDGVHLEMDFHNEAEVEQAMRIIEEYQTSAVEAKVDECIRVADTLTFDKPAAPRYRPLRLSSAFAENGASPSGAASVLASSTSRVPLAVPSLSETISDRILVLDGGFGTMAQGYGYKGCCDELVLSHPEVVQDIHRRYLAAGADIIETDTFSAQRISLADNGLQAKVRDINASAASIARTIADAFTLTDPSRPRYVAGSVGPTNKCVSISSPSGPLSREELADAYAEQMEALIEGGVDCLLIETIFDVENAYVALEASERVMDRLSCRLPVMLSFSQVNDEGINMNGQDVFEFIRRAARRFDIFSVGVNCTSEPRNLQPVVQRMAASLPFHISVYGNAGMPDSKGRYLQSPESFAEQNWAMVNSRCVNIVGGCCGTTDKHIALLRHLVEPLPGCYAPPRSSSASPAFPPPQSGVSSPAVSEAPAPSFSAPESSPSVSASSSASASSHPLLDAIVAGNQDAAVEATRAAVASGADPSVLINTQMIQAMSIVGRRFQEGKAFVPQLLMAGRAMKGALALLKPIMEASGEGIASAGRVVIGTVKGDLHDIGKNLVASMLEGSGFEVVNIGIDVDADTFVNAVVDNKADILCLSALLTTTMTYMQDVIAALERAGIRDKVKVMVGGAPVSQEFADEIGADGYSSNANEAVALAKRLMSS